MALDDITYTPQCVQYNGTRPTTLASTTATPYTGPPTTTTTEPPYTGPPTTTTTEPPYTGPLTTTIPKTTGPITTITAGPTTSTTIHIGKVFLKRKVI